MNKKPDQYDFDALYSDHYAIDQTKKFLLRKIRIDDICHWHDNIKLFIDEIAERLDVPQGATYLDLGCSIGTYAMELAGRGKKATGLDLSEDGIRTAELLAGRLCLKEPPRFVVGDVSQTDLFKAETFDVILAIDILEHLHEDVLIRAFENCTAWLKPGGYLVYHTHPTKYDYLFHSGGWKSTARLLPLVPVLIHGERKFKRAVQRYHRYIINPFTKLFTGKTQEEKIMFDRHCNLLTIDHIKELVACAGMISLVEKSANLYQKDRTGKRAFWFGRREYFHRNIYGVAWKPLPGFFRDRDPKRAPMCLAQRHEDTKSLSY